MLFAEVVTAAAEVAATRSRRAKIAALATLLGRLDQDEVVPAVGFLLGRPRQGRLGVGWRTIQSTRLAPAGSSALTIGDVDAALGSLAAAAGDGSAAARAATLRELSARATAAEQDLIVRMILGEVRTGALEGVVTEAIAAATEIPLGVVRRAAMLSGDLGMTARGALGGDDLTAVGLVVGRPILPMLAGTAATASEAIAATGEASVEYKLDGARIQVHRAGDDVRVFTRSLAEVTHRLPDVVEAVRALPVQQAIFDGETLALAEDGAPRPFQETMSRFGAERAREAVLRPWLFDALHVDGRDLIDEPLTTRRAELLRVAGELVIPGETTADPAVAERVAADALAAGHEGVVVKAVDAPYAAGRRGASWIKVKPVHTFDLVVLAAEWGHGRRSGWLSNLHLGARDATGEFGGDLVMVGKTFKGLTDSMIRWQTERFTQLEVRSEGSAERGGTVWVASEIVVEIAIDGVQRSTRYPGGLALRFARVKGYREDKRPDEADTIQTLRAMLPGGA